MTCSDFDRFMNVQDDIPAEGKPLPNEYSCRLKEPKGYTRYRRVNCAQRHAGKCIDVIYGIKDNKAEIQSLRYKKRIWTRSAAQAHCRRRGGRFDV